MRNWWKQLALMVPTGLLLMGGLVQADTVPSGMYARYTAQRNQTVGYGYHEIFQPDVYDMEEGDIESEELSLSGGTYRFKAICDHDCGDIDLEVVDARGRVIASDYLMDAIPIVSFTAGEGDYTVCLSMESCDWEPCQAVLMYLKK